MSTRLFPTTMVITYKILYGINHDKCQQAWRVLQIAHDSGWSPLLPTSTLSYVSVTQIDFNLSYVSVTQKSQRCHLTASDYQPCVLLHLHPKASKVINLMCSGACKTSSSTTPFSLAGNFSPVYCNSRVQQMCIKLVQWLQVQLRVAHGR